MKLIHRMVALFLLMALPHSAAAVLRIEINQSAGIQDQIPVAIVPFAVEGVDVGVDMAEVINADLERSGRFSLLDSSRFLSNPATAGEVVFSNWRLTDTEYLIVGKVSESSNSQVQVRFELVDIVKQRRLLAFQPASNGSIEYCCVYNIKRSQMRRTAHLIADLIYEQLTGIKGVFDTQFAYVSSTGRGSNKKFSVSTADIDGENTTRILSIGTPLMSPAWSPDGEQLAYVSFEFPGRSAIMVHHLVKAERRKLVSVDGINGAPAWSPDGRRLAVSLSHRGSPDIYVVEVDSGRMTQMTNFSSIETEPEWLDNERIVFTSNRSGSPQIYLQNLKRKNSVKRLTFEGNYNVAASAAPDGSAIAFVHQQDGNYRIAYQKLDSRVLTILTDGKLDESPSFSPNGDLILFAAQEKGNGELGVVGVDGYPSYFVGESGEVVRDPDWGPQRQ